MLRFEKWETLRSRCRHKLAYGYGMPAGTYSIPLFSKPCLETKSLAASSCRFHQSFPRVVQIKSEVPLFCRGQWE
jgi:hypothetical protein